jgi:transposase
MEEHEVGIFQHDNARPHAARVTREFLADNEVTVMDWPEYSPDLNPIEHLWDILGRRVMERGPANRNHLIQLLHQEWEAIPQEGLFWGRALKLLVRVTLLLDPLLHFSLVDNSFFIAYV